MRQPPRPPSLTHSSAAALPPSQCRRAILRRPHSSLLGLGPVASLAAAPPPLLSRRRAMAAAALVGGAGGVRAGGAGHGPRQSSAGLELPPRAPLPPSRRPRLWRPDPRKASPPPSLPLSPLPLLLLRSSGRLQCRAKELQRQGRRRSSSGGAELQMWSSGAAVSSGEIEREMRG